MAAWFVVLFAALIVALGLSNLRLRRELRQRCAAERELAVREQRALALAESRKRFVAHLGHEARNLVANIFGALLFFEQRWRVPDMPDLASTLRTSAQALHDLLNESLDAAQLDAGSFSVRPTNVDLTKLLQDLAAEVAPMAHGRSVLVGIEEPIAPGARWSVDGVRLAQIVRNLVINALKHAPRSEVRLKARVLAATNAGAAPWRLCLQVIDEGPGLSAEQQQGLFDEFTRVGATQRDGSVGLGLMISRRLARAMGGDLRVSSAPGAGTTFSLWLPLQLSVDGGAAVPGPAHSVEFSHFGHDRGIAGRAP